MIEAVGGALTVKNLNQHDILVLNTEESELIHGGVRIQNGVTAESVSYMFKKGGRGKKEHTSI